ncbi:MAG: right-handed parallel beta-helix repeat-containing protein [Desulfamplus sp.]|nr:right-handed parallel beta-helix repeat-containing protein [Desulfamplus sp.]
MINKKSKNESIKKIISIFYILGFYIFLSSMHIDFVKSAEMGELFEQIIPSDNTTVPRITLQGKYSIYDNEDLDITISDASYCETCEPFFHWEANDGQFIGEQNSYSIKWTPPEVNDYEKDFYIFCTIGDNKGKIFKQFFKVKVLNSDISNQNTHISGIIRNNGEGLQGVKLVGLPGDPQTGSSGGYLVYVPEGWSGTVTPEKAGYTFTPPNISYSNVTSDQTGQNYTASTSNYTISGTIQFEGTGLAGVLMEGLPNSPITDANGFYTGLVPHGWSGQVSPKKTGYKFTLSARYYSIVTSNKPGEDYTAYKERLKISGRILFSGSGLEGVVMYGLPNQPVSNSNGEYIAWVDEGWSGTVRPQKTGFSFFPASVTYTNVMVSEGNEDYTASGKAYTISGKITYQNNSLQGVILNGFPSATVTDAQGNYAATVPFHWSGSITPAKAGYTFVPSPKQYNQVGMSYADENYAGLKASLTITGKVTKNGTGLSGVYLNGLPGGIITDANGNYSASIESGWSGVVTPWRQGYLFTPQNLPYINITEPKGNQDYTAVLGDPCSNYIYIVKTASELNNALHQLVNRPGLVIVKPGTYQNVDFDLPSNSTVISESGAEQTIIQISNEIDLDNVASNIVIDGFSFVGSTYHILNVVGDNNIQIRNCIFDPPKYGIHVSSSTNVVIEGCLFLNNNGSDAGVFLYTGNSGGSITLRNNTFRQNVKGVLGGADYGLQLVFENNLFEGCTSYGVQVDEIGSLIVKNNIFRNNNIALNVDYVSGSVLYTQNTVVGNNVGADFEHSATVTNNIFSGNSRGLVSDGSSTLVSLTYHMENDVSPFYSTSGGNYSDLDHHTIWQNTDPLFVDAANGDYHLASNSPAKGIGSGGYDLGAYGGTIGNSWITAPGTPAAPPAITQIDIEGQANISPGETLNLYSVGHFENSYCGNIDNVALWGSNNPTVLESQGGSIFHALEKGEATVTASYGGQLGMMNVSVIGVVISGDKFDSADPVLPGEQYSYILNYVNVGTAIATNVVVTTSGAVTFLSANPSPETGTTNTWHIGDLSPGENGAIEVFVQAGNQLPAGFHITYEFSISADGITPVSFIEQTTIAGQAVLSLGKSCGTQSGAPGQELVYTISYQNTGTIGAEGVEITESYDLNTAFVSSVPPPTTGNNIWSIGGVEPGSSGAITVRVKIADSLSANTVITNNVVVSANNIQSQKATITTNAVIPQPTLNVVVGGGGSVRSTPSGIVNCRSTCNSSFDFGSDVTLVAEPDQGWQFAGWSGALNSNSSTDSIVMDGNKSITATFQNSTYTITALSGPGGSIAPEGSIGVINGQEKTFSIFTDSNYQILDVLVDGVSVSNVDTYTFKNISRDHSIYVSFYSPTYSISGYVRNADNSAVSGVTMNGLPGTPITNNSGYYSATVPHGWSGTVIPENTNHTFSPTSKIYLTVTANQAQDYTSIITVNYEISGYVQYSNGVGIEGVKMSGLPGDPITDSIGYFTGIVPSDWSGTVTPYKSFHRFDPISKSYSHVTNDDLNNYFLGTEFSKNSLPWLLLLISED